MTLNKQKGNMYEDVITRNYLGGCCNHRCKYCWVNNLKKRFKKIKERYSGKLRLLESEFKKPLKKGKTYFICACNDMFQKEVPSEYIKRILDYCKRFDNTYLFQSKNPNRFLEFINSFPEKTILGTTIETTKYVGIVSDAPPLMGRMQIMECLKIYNIKRAITIEPILEFNLKIMVSWIKRIKPDLVFIGADSKKNNLPEPSKEKVDALIKELKKFTEVKIKDNLKRLR